MCKSMCTRLRAQPLTKETGSTLASRPGLCECWGASAQHRWELCKEHSWPLLVGLGQVEPKRWQKDGAHLSNAKYRHWTLSSTIVSQLHPNQRP